MQQISKDNFFGKFSKLYNSLNHSFYKVESLQYYKDDMDSKEYKLFVRGKKKEALSILKESFSEEIEDYKKTLKKGVSLKRVHLVSFPINKYLYFELQAYNILKDLGEKIYFAKFNDVSFNTLKPADFMLFDNKHLLINTFDKNAFTGGLYTNDEYEVKKYVQLWKNIFSKAANYQKFATKYF